MKTITNQGAQGDILIMRVDSMPDGVKEVEADAQGRLVVAHSETGHHHYVNKAEAKFYADPKDEFTCYLTVEGEGAVINHARPFDTHEAVKLAPTVGDKTGSQSVFMLRRQREHTPEGYRRIED
jgi:hypothetical protein